MSLSIDNTTFSSFHFVGILGAGMSAIAQFLRWEGYAVSGSDRSLDANHTVFVRDRLADIGCSLHEQDGSGVTADTGCLVASTAIESSNPDIARAQQLGIAIFHRSEVLAAIAATRRTVAVAGTSGKSSVSAMIFHALKGCGKSPSLITGANLNELISRGMVGNAYHGDSDLLVIEADESDGSLVRYSPALSVFLNVSKDHKPVPEVIEMFKTLAMQSSQSVVNDDVPEFEQLRRTATFGASSSVTYRASALQAFCDTAAVTVDGTWYTMSQPGMHNAWNLLATVASCLQLRCRPEDLSKVIPGYGGIQRRFDLRRTRNDVIVIDDYAHNPDKIHAAVTTAHMLAERLFVLFQPHGFGPTRFMREELVGVFRDVLKKQDRLYLLPIYYAGGTADRSISSADLANDLSDSPATILAPDDRDEALREIAEKAKAGDAVLSMGARDPSLASFARRIAEAIDERG